MNERQTDDIPVENNESGSRVRDENSDHHQRQEYGEREGWRSRQNISGATCGDEARVPSSAIEGLHVTGGRETWLQVGDRYVITVVPNRLLGAEVNEEGEAV